MHPNETLICSFYKAFQDGDYRTMQDAYHAEATFSDPVFGNLNAAETKAMWKMLVTSAKDLKVVFAEVKANDKEASCRWDAWYTFSGTGRKVHNVIKAHFTFQDGKIFRHSDRFSFWRWSRMAMGTTGLLMGWSPFLVDAVHKMAQRRLRRFMENDR